MLMAVILLFASLAGPAVAAEEPVMDRRLAEALFGAELDPVADGGAEVRLVAPGSTAASLRLRVGDRIVACDGEPVAGPAELVTALARGGPGRRLRLSVVRGGERLELAGTLDPPRRTAPAAAPAAGGSARLSRALAAVAGFLDAAPDTLVGAMRAFRRHYPRGRFRLRFEVHITSDEVDAGDDATAGKAVAPE